VEIAVGVGVSVGIVVGIKSGVEVGAMFVCKAERVPASEVTCNFKVSTSGSDELHDCRISRGIVPATRNTAGIGKRLFMPSSYKNISGSAMNPEQGT
jgi:hypothetical protein